MDVFPLHLCSVLEFLAQSQLWTFETQATFVTLETKRLKVSGSLILFRLFTRDEVKTHRQQKAHPPCLVAQLDHHPVGGGRYPHIHGQHKAHPPHPKVDSCKDVACVSVKDAIILLLADGAPTVHNDTAVN